MGSPAVGACVDTTNAMGVTEDPMTAVEKLAPRAVTNHFCDHMVNFERDGFRFSGTAVGEGDMDLVRAYEIIHATSPTRRLNIETEMGIPLDDRDRALGLAMDAVERSVAFCRNVLGVRREPGDN